jgi:ankyrin repeat protein
MNDSNIAFLQAAEYGDHETMIRLRHHVDIEYVDDCGYSALHYAVMGNHYSTVELLLDMGANINSKTYYQNTPLTFCDDRRIPIARLLIQMGADIDGLCEYKDTSFSNACLMLNHKLATLLLEFGADVNHADMNQKTALMRSVSTMDGDRSLPIVNLLLYEGTASIHAVDAAQCSLLEYAALNVDGFPTIQALVNMGLVCEKKELETLLCFFRPENEYPRIVSFLQYIWLTDRPLFTAPLNTKGQMLLDVLFSYDDPYLYKWILSIPEVLPSVSFS